MRSFTINACVAGVLLASLAGGFGQTTSTKKSPSSSNDNQSNTNVLKMGAVRRMDIVYDNTATTNFTGQFYFTTNEFGDQITLSTSNTNRYMAKFSFGYYLGEAASGKEQIILRFYKNDGPKDTPGTLLWPLDKEPKPLPLKKGYNTAVIEGLAFLAPDSFTWTVQFIGVKSGVTAGLLIFSPPLVGFSLADFWEKVDGKWTLKITPGKPSNYCAQVIATDIFEAAGAQTLPAPFPPDNPDVNRIDPIYKQL